MNSFKKITNKKEKFLAIVELNNMLLKEESKLSKQDALKIFNQEISPYGYPSHQTSCLAKGVTVYDFNYCLINNRFEGLNLDPDALLDMSYDPDCPNFYITDDLAGSLFNTETPDDSDFIRKAVSLNVLPKINVVFSHDFKLDNEDHNLDVLHSIGIKQKDNHIQIFVSCNKQSGSILYEFGIPIVEHDCCFLCESQKYFDENNGGAINYAFNMALYLTNFQHKDWSRTKFSSEFIEERKENTELFVNHFRKSTLPHVFKFVINLLCLMTKQPEIISVQKSASKYIATTDKGFASKKVNNVPNVHWLGADFTTRVQYSKKINTGPSDITRGKPKRSHWRRGHWHTILQGPGRLQKKLRWFQPVFIKGHKQEVTQ